MRAGFIFSQNDVIANAAVVASGVLVALTGLRLWDLASGAGIALLLAWGALRLFQAAREGRGSG